MKKDIGHVNSLRQAYRGRRVLVTGHTGFKGSWLDEQSQACIIEGKR